MPRDSQPHNLPGVSAQLPAPTLCFCISGEPERLGMGRAGQRLPEGREGMPDDWPLMGSFGTGSRGSCKYSRPTPCTGPNRATARPRALWLPCYLCICPLR